MPLPVEETVPVEVEAPEGAKKGLPKKGGSRSSCGGGVFSLWVGLFFWGEKDVGSDKNILAQLELKGGTVSVVAGCSRFHRTASSKLLGVGLGKSCKVVKVRPYHYLAEKLVHPPWMPPYVFCWKIEVGCFVFSLRTSFWTRNWFPRIRRMPGTESTPAAESGWVGPKSEMDGIGWILLCVVLRMNVLIYIIWCDLIWFHFISFHFMMMMMMMMMMMTKNN